jgi:hypothetical protein
MKKMNKFIFAITVFLAACTKNAQLQEATEPPPVDSFTVSGIDIGQQADNFQYINDSTLASYDLTTMNLVFFHKDANGNYKAGIKKEIDTEFWSMYFRGDDGKHYFADADNNIAEYNLSADSLLKRYTIPHRFQHLKDSFGLTMANCMPILKIHDTIIAVIGPNSNESLRLYFNEQEISEFKVDPLKDTISYIRSYITKPVNLSDYDFPMASYCFHHNTVFLIYPHYDTIYSFNRSTNSLRKIAIQNQDFTPPAKFTCQPFTPEYGSCATKYYLNNFRYNGIYYNPLTKHFVLFYNAPVKPIKDHIPTFKDQPLRAMILDEQLNILSYHTLNKTLGLGSESFLIPGKGLAMPVSAKNYETTHFYIYNL